MILKFQFNALPHLRAGETVLLFKKWIWALSVTSSPSYRVFGSFPPFFEAGLYITNRRVLVVASVLRLLMQEVSQWRAGTDDAQNADVITHVELGRGRLFGPYLDVFSNANQRKWYRSPELRLRLYMQNAEDACRIIEQFLPAPSDNSPRPLATTGPYSAGVR